MKYLKLYENKDKIYSKEDVDKLNSYIGKNPNKEKLKYHYFLINHPRYKDSDLYMFIANEEFKENENCSFRKTFAVEKFILFDLETDYIMIGGLHSRIKYGGQFNNGNNKQHLYSVWLTKGMMEEITSKEDNRVVYPNEVDEYMTEFIINHATILR